MTTTQQTFVIVGAGLAGAKAAEALPYPSSRGNLDPVRLSRHRKSL